MSQSSKWREELSEKGEMGYGNLISFIEAARSDLACSVCKFRYGLSGLFDPHMTCANHTRVMRASTGNCNARQMATNSSPSAPPCAKTKNCILEGFKNAFGLCKLLKCPLRSHITEKILCSNQGLYNTELKKKWMSKN